jgi:hypothetical protein
MHRQFAHLPSTSRPENRARSTGPISIDGRVRSIEKAFKKSQTSVRASPNIKVCSVMLAINERLDLHGL